MDAAEVSRFVHTLSAIPYIYCNITKAGPHENALCTLLGIPHKEPSEELELLRASTTRGVEN